VIGRVTPLLWLLFSAGGTIAALLFPAVVFFVALAIPLGWVPTPPPDALLRFLQHPLTRVALFVGISLPLFHWAHRFRYTLYDGLQLYHLTNFIAVLCYGAALAGSILAAWVLITL
jgi:fumarate reductase subunit D